MTTLSFKNQGLTVDWIGFNCQKLSESNLKKVAIFLSERGFNSTLATKIDGKWKSKNLNYDSRNRFQVSFRQHEYDPETKSFWVGTKVNFSGDNAAQFYKIIQQHKFNWNLFTRASLSRFDLCYLRKHSSEQNYQKLERFMQESCQKIHAKSKRRHASWHRNSKGLILKIGSRTSSNYYRVYQAPNELRFELEIKHKVVQSFQKYLFDNNLQTFEHKLSRHFYSQSFESLTLNAYCIDWLLHWYRTKSNKTQTSSLITTYFTNKNRQKQQQIYNLLKLLSFIKNRETSEVFIDEQIYYLVQAPLSQFIAYLGMTHTNHRHRTKTLSILHDLQTLQPILENFDDCEFRSSVSFPYFKIKKKGKIWILTIAIAKQLHEYKYPYRFTEYFLQSDNQYHQQVQCFIIQTISTYSLEKHFTIRQFISQFNLSNQKKTQIKKYIIQAFHQLIQNQLIQKQLKVIKNNGYVQYVNSNDLTTKLITQANQIHAEEIIHYKHLFKQISTWLD